MGGDDPVGRRGMDRMEGGDEIVGLGIWLVGHSDTARHIRGSVVAVHYHTLGADF